MILQKLQNQGLLDFPKWVIDNTQMVVMMGSHAYGTNQNDSDIDLYGITIQKKLIYFLIRLDIFLVLIFQTLKN
jgi:hypothetical protein